MRVPQIIAHVEAERGMKFKGEQGKLW